MATKPKAKNQPGYHCTECGWKTVKWIGRCGECQSWGTVEEIGGPATARTQATSVREPAQRIGDVDIAEANAIPTEVPELDRVLGGGLVPGSVVLMAGEPGVGKSTLILDLAARVARSGRTSLYVTAEESAAQVTLRAKRIDAMAEELYLVSETDLGTILGHVENLQPDLLIIDSVQTVSSTAVEGVPGGVTQVREVAGSIINAAKASSITTILVGHVTKDGSIAGPRVLEHLVDVVCQFEGDRHSRLRMVRAIKNRYGPTDEVGCFDLNEDGIIGLLDPSGLFLSRTSEPVAGTCVTVALEGRRPLVAEVQALMASTHNAQPRRATSGLDSARASMLLAVLQRRAGFPLSNYDSYLATVGGVKLTEPAVDLAAAVAMASAFTDQPVSQTTVAFGEVGLAGEVRAVPGIGRRIQEAARLGFTHAIIPRSASGPGALPDGFRVTQVETLPQALQTFQKG